MSARTYRELCWLIEDARARLVYATSSESRLLWARRMVAFRKERDALGGA